jgi:hypothetical protein
VGNLEQALVQRDWEHDEDGLRGVLHSAHQQATAPGVLDEAVTALGLSSIKTAPPLQPPCNHTLKVMSEIDACPRQIPTPA